MTPKYNYLILSCLFLYDQKVPLINLESDNPTDWNKILDKATKIIGNKLTDTELTCLSLSRCFGPMPAISCVFEKELILNHIWPTRNPNNGFIDWLYLAKKIKEL